MIGPTSAGAARVLAKALARCTVVHGKSNNYQWSVFLERTT